jgi:prepilin-type N-terminal cleavage/methylation domain-containing protein
VTLTELLVVLVIISILSTVAAPVYINQAERARTATAQQEVRELGSAMEACGLEHGRFVPLQTLDDLPGSSSDQNDTSADAILDSSGLDAIDFNVPVQNMATAANSPISTVSPDPRTKQMVDNWKGPFINFQRFFDGTPNTIDRNKSDFPLDPWGGPYHLYSPVGHVGSPASNVGFTVSSFDGDVTNDDDRFDRWAVVSYGPDGQSDTQTGALVNDDIVYVFAFATAETNFSGATTPPVIP